MRQTLNQRALWLILVLVAAIPRILGALFLPNAFGDAYVYIRDIGSLSMKMRAGTFATSDLYGFWLPLYQFISAFPNVFIGNGFYWGKLVAAVFGVGVCLLVYRLTMQLTGHRFAALLAFALIALNPLHIFYSASAMTDVPHASFVIAGLYFCSKERWILAALMAAFAGLTRMESWMFIALIPAIQFVRERRVSIFALAILLMPPLFWFYISWKATGTWYSSFLERRQYHDWLLNANPTLAQFSPSRILRDAAMLIVSTDIAVLIAAFVAGCFVLKRLGPALRSREFSRDSLAIISPIIFFFAFLGLIVVAYLTGAQPIIFPRYGLILFTLGIPILAWTFLKLSHQKPDITRLLLISIITICAFDASVQLVGSIGLLNQISTQRVVADYLRDHFDAKSSTRILCDDGTVQVLSGIPEEKFVTSQNAPKDREAFLSFLDQNNIEYLIVVDTERSTPFELFPRSEYNEPIGNFESIVQAHTDFLLTNIHVYLRIRRAA